MKNKIYSLFLFIAIGLIFASCDTQKERISVNIEGLGNDTIFIQYIPLQQYGSSESAPVKDTIMSVDGKFVYNLPEDTTSYIMVIIPTKIVDTKIPFSVESKTIELTLPANEKIKINGKVEGKHLNYQIDGSQFNKDFAIQRLNNIDISIAIDSLSMNVEQLASLRDPSLKDSIQGMNGKLREAYAQMRDKQLAFIKQNPANDLSAYYIIRQHVDTFGVYYPTLSETVKNGFLKPLLDKKSKDYNRYKEMQENKKKIVEGAVAPDFTLKNMEGKDVSLSSLKGKYLVLDFWGSWCGWCIKGYPRMKEYYNKYKSKVEFVGIACRDTDKDWRAAVEKNQLDWTQLINDESGDTSKNVSTLYAIQGYPTKIILDKELKIVSVIVGESDDFYKKLDELLK